MTRLMDTVRFRDLNIVRGVGSQLHSGDGRHWLDFFTDVGTAALGYDSPEARAALRRVSERGIVHSPILFSDTTRESAAEMLCSATRMDRVFFCNSGAEAVEGAIKLARAYQSKQKRYPHIQEIWSHKGGFHGRTLATLAAGDGPVYHTQGFGPLPEGFHHFEHIDEIPASAAAVLLAPVFGNNDVRPLVGPTWARSRLWLQELRQYTKQHGILLIFDEVQTGSGRCGSSTYAQRLGVEPDIITLGKGVAMGAPVGAVIARSPVAETFTPGMHFSTFGGNPLCAAFLIQMLNWLADPGNLSGVEDRGQIIAGRLADTEGVSAVRYVGMLVAADVGCDTLELAARCEANGLLLGAFRHGPGPLKITPPLNISLGDLNTGLDILCSNIKALSS